MFDSFRRRIRYLRLSVTDRCNLRCVYCMPPEGIEWKRPEEILSFEEIEALVRVAVRFGFTKLRLTGGEPLVRKGILALIRRLAAIPGIEDYAMTTNGTLLAACAPALCRAGLQRINISLDTMDPERYCAITRGGRLDDARAGIEAACRAGFRQVKLNCVVERSPDEPDARAVAAYAAGRGLEVRFIRRMNPERGEFWSVIGGAGGRCAQCDRIRVSADGFVYPCLFSDIRYSVRERGAEQALRLAVQHKPASGRVSHHRLHAIGG